MILISGTNWLQKAASVLTATDQVAALPVSQLKDPQAKKRWRTNNTVNYAEFLADLGQDRNIGVLALAQPQDPGYFDADDDPTGYIPSNGVISHRLSSTAQANVAQNLIPYSEEGLGNTSAPYNWARANFGTPVPNYGVNPFGTEQNTTRLNGGASTNNYIRYDLSVTPDTSLYTFSFYAKPISDTYSFRIDLWCGAVAGTGLSGSRVVYNPFTGAISTPTTGSLILPIDYGVELLPNGFSRLWVTIANANQPFIWGLFAHVDINKSSEVWGAQLETGVTLPSAYIKTTGAAVIGPGKSSASYYSKPIAPNIIPGYGVHTHKLANPITARYWYAAMGGAIPANFLDMGLAWAGPVWVPSTNISFNWEWSMLDRAEISQNPRSGLRFVDKTYKQLVLAFSFDYLSESDAKNDLRAILEFVGNSKQILVAIEPEDASVGTQSIIGTIANVPKIIQTSEETYSVQFEVHQSL